MAECVSIDTNKQKTFVFDVVSHNAHGLAPKHCEIFEAVMWWNERRFPNGLSVTYTNFMADASSMISSFYIGPFVCRVNSRNGIIFVYLCCLKLSSSHFQFKTFRIFRKIKQVAILIQMMCTFLWHLHSILFTGVIVCFRTYYQGINDHIRLKSFCSDFVFFFFLTSYVHQIILGIKSLCVYNYLYSAFKLNLAWAELNGLPVWLVWLSEMSCLSKRTKHLILSLSCCDNDTIWLNRVCR